MKAGSSKPAAAQPAAAAAAPLAAQLPRSEPTPALQLPAPVAAAAPSPPLLASGGSSGGSGFKAGFLNAPPRGKAPVAAPRAVAPAAAAGAGGAAAAPPAGSVAAAAAAATFLGRFAAPPSVAHLPSRLQQRFDIGRISAQHAARGLQVGDAWCVLPAAWWRHWCAFVGGFSDADDVAPCLRLLKRTGTLSFTPSDDGVAAEWQALRAAEALDAAAAAPAGGAGSTLGGGDSAHRSRQQQQQQQLAGSASRRPRGGDEEEGEEGDAGDDDNVAASSARRTPPGPLDPLPLLDPQSIAAAAAAAGEALPPPGAPPSAPPPPPSVLALRASLTPEDDYVVLGEEVGKALRAWYGSRGPAIVRYVVPDPQELLESASESAAAVAPQPVRRFVALYPERLLAAATAAAAAAAGAATAGSPGAGGDPGGRECFACGQRGAMSKCTQCGAAYYCSRECQKSHWAAHKTQCSEASHGGGGSTSPGWWGGGSSARRRSLDATPPRNGLRGLVK